MPRINNREAPHRRIGYARAAGSALPRLVRSLAGAGCAAVFTDLEGGEDAGMTALLRATRAGDAIVVADLTHLGSPSEILSLVGGLEARGIRVEMQIGGEAAARGLVAALRATTNPAPRAVAKRGRPPVLGPEAVAEVAKMREAGMDYSSIARLFRMHPSNVKRTLDRYVAA